MVIWHAPATVHCAPHGGTKVAKCDDQAIIYIMGEDEPLSAIPEKQPGSAPGGLLVTKCDFEIRFRANTT